MWPLSNAPFSQAVGEKIAISAVSMKELHPGLKHYMSTNSSSGPSEICWRVQRMGLAFRIGQLWSSLLFGTDFNSQLVFLAVSPSNLYLRNEAAFSLPNPSVGLGLLFFGRQKLNKGDPLAEAHPYSCMCFLIPCLLVRVFRARAASLSTGKCIRPWCCGLF